MRQRDRDFVARMLSLANALRDQGVSRAEFAPPLYRLVWRLGFRPRPPIYQPLGVLLLSNALPCALFCGIFWGLGMSLGFTIAGRLVPFMATLPVEAHDRIVIALWWAAAAFGTGMGLVATVNLVNWKRQTRDLWLPPIEDESDAA